MNESIVAEGIHGERMEEIRATFLKERIPGMFDEESARAGRIPKPETIVESLREKLCIDEGTL